MFTNVLSFIVSCERIDEMKKILLCLLLILSGCTVQQKPQQKYYAVADFIYDMDGNSLLPLNTTIQLMMFDEKELNKKMNVVNDLVFTYHALFDAYHTFENVNNVKIINEKAGTGEAVVVDDALFEVVRTAVEMTKLSDGKFNLTVEPLYQLYQPLFSSFPVVHNDPNRKDIERCLSCVVSPDKIDDVIVLDEEHKTIEIKSYDGCKDNVQIILGAIAKGYVTDQLVAYLNQSGLPYLLDVGSSSVYGRNQELWKVGIRSPYNHNEALYPVYLPKDTAMSTSGDEQNFYLVENEDGSKQVRCHILDTTLGYSPNYYRNVTVLTESNMLADALSTILFLCKDQEEVKKYTDIFEKYYQCKIEYGLMKELDANQQELVLITSEGYQKQIIQEYVSSHIVKQEIMYE